MLLNGPDNSPKLPLPLGPWGPWFLGLTTVSHPNGISISSEVFAGLMNVNTDRQTDRPRYSVSSNKPLSIAAIQPNNKTRINNNNTSVLLWINAASINACFRQRILSVIRNKQTVKTTTSDVQANMQTRQTCHPQNDSTERRKVNRQSWQQKPSQLTNCQGVQRHSANSQLSNS